MRNVTRPNDERIVVIGATSALAQVAVREWAAQGARLFLVARDAAKLDAVVRDARIRGGTAQGMVLTDFMDSAAVGRMLDSAAGVWGGLDGVLIAHGWLPVQEEVQDDPAKVSEVLHVNGESVCRMLALLAPRFAARRGGWIAAISSVAADRGRAKMYVYGAAKAMVSHFMSGLRQRLRPAGVRVIDIRPGPVATPMTAGLTMPLMADPVRVGCAIVRACARRNGTVYLPWFWRLIMFVLVHVPEKIWVKMKI